MDDSSEETISKFSQKLGVNYPILVGTEKVADLYGGVEGLPMSFFVDRSGKLVNRHIGLVSEHVIEDDIKKSLETTAAANNQRSALGAELSSSRQ